MEKMGAESGEDENSNIVEEATCKIDK